MFEAQAKQAGFRLIGVDRPGMGLSDFQPERQILDWPDDVVALADALGIERFSVVGNSGGGLYAAACAYQIPKRLVSCGLVSSFAPLDSGADSVASSLKAIAWVGRYLPGLLGPLMWLSLGRYAADEEKARALIADQMLQNGPEPDKKLFRDNPAALVPFVAGFREAFRQGVNGPAYEGKLLTRPWGFRLEEISLDGIYLWHGELDDNAPISSARLMAARIPHCRATFYPNEGHGSTIGNHISEILSTLCGQ
jgi:pimeloyl-ACP methyl ester carboxylesterase